MALRILLADDSMTAQNMGKKILTDAGFDVVTVSNGAAAVKKLAESTPDIAILDVYMPGYTGLELCERLKSAPGTARVPVLLSVGKMEPFRPEEGMKVRADGVIIKPFEATDLVTVIDKLAERAYGSEAKSGAAVAEEQAEEEQPAEEEQIPSFEEPAPARETTAEGLETFAPVADVAHVVAPEPHVEFTSVPKVGEVSAEQAEDLMPTLVQPHELDSESSADVPPAPILEPIQEAVAEEAQPTSLETVEESFAAAQKTSAGANEESYDIDADALTEESALQAANAGTEESSFPAAAATEEQAFTGGDINSSLPVEFAAEDEAAAQIPELAIEVPTAEISSSSEIATDPALLPREEEVSLAPAAAEAESGNQAQDAQGWTTVEAEVAEDIDLDLEAEMHEGIAVPEPTFVQPPAPSAPPVQQAAPFLAPLGKTSFDEFDTVMEQHTTEVQTDSVVAEEIALAAPIADPAEQEPALTPQDDIAVPIDSDELLGTTIGSRSIESDIDAPAAEPVLQDPAHVVFQVAQEVAPPPPQEAVSAESGELLETGDANKDALAFYGLAEDESGDILRNPVDELDEPLFSLANELAPLPQTSDAQEETLLEDAPVQSTDILESEPAQPTPTPEPVEAEVLSEPAEEASVLNTMEEVRVEQAAEPTIVEEAIEPDPMFDVAETAALEEIDVPEQEAAAPAEGTPAPEVLAEPDVAEIVPQVIDPVETAIPDTEMPLSNDAAGSEPPAAGEVTPAEPAPEEVAAAIPVAALAAAAAAELNRAAGPVAGDAQKPTIEEAVGTGMVGRVVDRVVDRLKPILTIMVEELLKEVKK